MPLVGLAKVLLLVAGRMLLVLCIATPVLLLLLLAGVFGRGGEGSGLLLFVTVGLSGLGWAFLPFIHASRASGVLFGICWFAFALFHIVTQPSGSLTGAAVLSWSIATIFLAIKLKGNPPGYFPPGWRDSA